MAFLSESNHFAAMTGMCWVHTALVGILSLLVVRTLFRTFLRPSKNLRSFGEWAVVTGATDGIGKAYAAALARKGMNVVLISRTQSKLDTVAEEIRQQGKKAASGKGSGVRVETVAVDFSNFDADAQARVDKVLSAVGDVGLLINNVGVSYDHPEFFTALSDRDVTNLLKVNVESVLWMTRLVLPGMEERKRGAIVNISSAAASLPSPLLAEYAAAKGFVNHFSEGLAKEGAARGVHVQLQTPFFVTTKLAKIRRPSFFTPTPDTFVKHSLAQIGYENRTVPYWPHALQLFALNCLPHTLREKIVLDTHLGIRKKALKKKAEKSK